MKIQKGGAIVLFISFHMNPSYFLKVYLIITTKKLYSNGHLLNNGKNEIQLYLNTFLVDFL
jgi:hypothetical protein